MVSGLLTKHTATQLWGFFCLAAALSLAALILVIVWARQDALQADTFREVADLHGSSVSGPNA